MADDPVWGSQTEMTALIALDSDDLLMRDLSNTADDATGTVLRMKANGLLGMAGATPGGRLTTESGVPVSTSDRTAQGTIYYTPYAHDFVRLYNGTRPTLYTFTERSLALTLTSGKNYDVFLYDNSGTLTLELSAAWTTDTTRADALAWQAGVGYVKSGTATRLHLGTIRASGTNTTESSWATTDAPAKSFMWNRYNQVTRQASVIDSTDTWTYTTATIRQRRGSTNNQAEFVCGDVTPWYGMFSTLSVNSGTVGRQIYIGLDSTSAYTGCCGYFPVISSQYSQQTASGSGVVAAGYHYVAALERADAASTTTWAGDLGVTYLPTGLFARIQY